MARAAAIDIGSNSVLLTIAEPGVSKPIPLKILYDEAVVTGLSKGLSGAGEIIHESEVRTAKALRHFRSQIEAFTPDQFRVVGTEAFRRARNGDDVKQRFSEILQREIEIIPGNKEAELSFWSVQKEHPQRETPKLVFDIGGASTELCLGGSNGIEQRISLKVGSVVLTEIFMLQGASKPDLAEAYVRKMLNELPWSAPPKTLGIGVAGTITSLIAIDQEISIFTRDRVHGFEISTDRLKMHRDSLLAKEPDERRRIVGLQPDRADVLGGGLVIATAIAEHFNWPSLTCMDAGVRFGLLYEILGL